jgi:hypothetical protein
MPLWLSISLIAAAFLTGYALGRRQRRPKCFQCDEAAVGMLGTAPLCDRHYHEFRGQYPSGGEG